MKTITLSQFNAMTPAERAAFTLELQHRRATKLRRKEFVKVIQGGIEQMREAMKKA